MPEARATKRHATWRTELSATLTLALPLAAANLLQMLVYAIDVMFVARLGTTPLAAVSLSIALFGTFGWALSGLTGMVSALIAAALGRGTGVVREVRRATRMALWLAVMFGVALALVCQFGEAIMLFAGQDPEISRQAGAFLGLLGWAAIPMLIANVLRSYVSALGRPLFATMVLVLAVASAALGNYAFVFGRLGAPAMGIEGAALASNLTSWAMVLAYAAAIHFDRRLARFHIWGRWWSPDWGYFRRLLALGTPVSLTVLAEAGVFNGAAFMMGLIGTAQLAGHTLALQIAAFAFQVPFGVAQAATIRVGYHFGARDPAGIARAGWAAIVIGTGFMTLTAAAMLFAPHALLMLYVDPYAAQNAALVAFAVQFMAVAAAFQLFDGLQAVAAGSLRGLQDTRVPMVIAILGYWAPGFGTMVWLGFFTPLAGVGVWLGLLVGLVVVAVALLWRWARRERLGLLPAAKDSWATALDPHPGRTTCDPLALSLGECQEFFHHLREASIMAFRPLHDRVLVRRIEADAKTAGGIIIPDSAQEKPSEGEIVAVGTGARNEQGQVHPLEVKAGDRVLFGKWSGTEVKLDGEDLLIMKESDIMGIVG